MFDAHESFSMPTVEELLSLPELMRGRPEVIASTRSLQAPVRWAHVVAGETSPALLDGGEFALTTGAGFPPEGAELRALLHRLCDAGISALVCELGSHFPTAPHALREVFTERDTALIILHTEVKFVHLTQRIHRKILGAQNEALRAKERVHQLFTELGLNRSPVDYMVEQMAVTMGAPIVLENSAGQVVAWWSPNPDDSPRDVLEPWSRGMFVAPAIAPADREHEGVTRIPVEAQGQRWGMLTALPGPCHPAGRHTVLELGAIALALSRLADESDEWIRLSSKQLFTTLLGGRYRNDTDLQAQLLAAGLPFAGCTLFGLSLTSVGDFGAHVTLERSLLETALRRAVAPEGRAIIAEDTETPHADERGVSLLALVSLPVGDSRATSTTGAEQGTSLAERLDRELGMLVPSTTPAAWRAHLSLGVPTGDRYHEPSVRGLVTSIEGVRAAGILAPSAATGRVTVQEAQRQPLAYLLRDFSGSPALQRYVETVLGPLIAHDSENRAGHSGDLLRVLASYLAHPTNRSLAATEAHLSRSVFYQRLSLIERLLGVDLADGETITTLSVALMAHGIHS